MTKIPDTKYIVMFCPNERRSGEWISKSVVLVSSLSRRISSTTEIALYRHFIINVLRERQG